MMRKKGPFFWLGILMMTIILFTGCAKIASQPAEHKQPENSTSGQDLPAVDSKEALKALQTAINFMSNSATKPAKLEAVPLNYKAYYDPNQKETFLLFEVSLKDATQSGEPVNFYIMTTRKGEEDWRFFYSGEGLEVAAADLFKDVQATKFENPPTIKSAK